MRTHIVISNNKVVLADESGESLVSLQDHTPRSAGAAHLKAENDLKRHEKAHEKKQAAVDDVATKAAAVRVKEDVLRL